VRTCIAVCNFATCIYIRPYEVNVPSQDSPVSPSWLHHPSLPSLWQPLIHSPSL
jgi:hypothetical protein